MKNLLYIKKIYYKMVLLSNFLIVTIVAKYYVICFKCHFDHNMCVIDNDSYIAWCRLTMNSSDIANCCFDTF